MKLIDQVEVKLEFADMERLMTQRKPLERQERSEGVHVSHVLRYLAKKFNMYSTEDESDEMPLRMMLGLAFEEYASRLYPNLWWQQGEYERDGIYGNPDGIDEYGYIHEFKYSGKSIRVKGGTSEQWRDIRSEWLWMHQAMAYLNMMQADTNVAVFHICWKYGAYNWPMIERYFRYLVEFTEEELEGNWKMITGHMKEVAQ